jgi:hypothetical protein
MPSVTIRKRDLFGHSVPSDAPLFGHPSHVAYGRKLLVRCASLLVRPQVVERPAVLEKGKKQAVGIRIGCCAPQCFTRSFQEVRAGWVGDASWLVGRRSVAPLPWFGFRAERLGANEIPNTTRPDEKFVISAGVWMSPRDQPAPHQFVCRWKRGRAAHRRTPSWFDVRSGGFFWYDCRIGARVN